MDEPRRRTGILPVVTGVIAGLLTIYALGYVLGGKQGIIAGTRARVYPSAWQAKLFAPAARVESLLIGHEVGTGHLE